VTDAEPHRELSYLLGFDPLHRLSDDEKIAYIEERTTRMVLEAARNARVRALGEPLEEGRRIDSNLGLMTLICCSIEALGHFLAGRTPEMKRCETCNQPVAPSAAEQTSAPSWISTWHHTVRFPGFCTTSSEVRWHTGSRFLVEE
jgi:uncharacterized protein with PIN domain